MSNWKEEENALCASYQFKNFREAFGFMTEVAIESEKMNHHPNWSNVWNKVEFKLNTHDAGDVVTDKDHALAQKIDEVYSKY